MGEKQSNHTNHTNHNKNRKSFHKKRNSVDELRIIGASENNLKNVSLSLPKGKFVVFTGPSGSGKSSLAFNVIYREGQRRYLEGLSAYARNYLDISAKPRVEKIENISPTIAIDQKSVAKNPRSTVGTLTELYDYLRVLFAKLGEVTCPECGKGLTKTTTHDILNEIQQIEDKTHVLFYARVLLTPQTAREQMSRFQKEGYRTIRLDGDYMMPLGEFDIRAVEEDMVVEVLIDKMLFQKDRFDKERVLNALSEAFKNSSELVVVGSGEEEKVYQKDYFCSDCRVKVSNLSTRNFSFNNPEGACEACSGLGTKLEFDPELLLSNGSFSLEEGAVNVLNRFISKGGSKNEFWSSLERYARKNKISLKSAFNSYSKKIRQELWYGTHKKVKGEFEGITVFLERKYFTSTSDNLRKELERYMELAECPVCEGARLQKASLGVRVKTKNITEWSNLTLEQLREELDMLCEENKESESLSARICHNIASEMVLRLDILLNIGLGYLTLIRSSETLSGGEGQRIRLSVQLVSELAGVIYILDEPSMGLHSRDTNRLINTLKRLRDNGNTVLVVEHDRDIMEAAEYLVDIGPGAGDEGGEIIFSGTHKQLAHANTLTADYLYGRKKITRKRRKVSAKNPRLVVHEATENNLKNTTVSFPLNALVAITGVSGSGKSTLVSDILSIALRKHFYNIKENPGKHKKISGIRQIKKVISVCQSPIGRTSRSNVATYTGVFSLVRTVFAETPAAQSRGFDASKFSFNLKGGRCEACQGEGVKKIEMYLMPDMYVSCDVCGGSRYHSDVLDIRYQDKTISDVLDMSVSLAKIFFSKHPHIFQKLDVLEQVGLGYLKLGQGSPNLSGGEAQRIKLASELSRKSTGKTLYILDEPTIGLHFEDTKRLLKVMSSLVEKGNTVIVVEHNTEIIRAADWVIDMGPDGGERGGEVVFEGTPADLKKRKNNFTARYL